MRIAIVSGRRCLQQMFVYIFSQKDIFIHATLQCAVNQQWNSRCEYIYEDAPAESTLPWNTTTPTTTGAYSTASTSSTSTTFSSPTTSSMAEAELTTFISYNSTTNQTPILAATTSSQPESGKGSFTIYVCCLLFLTKYYNSFWQA